MSNRVTLTLALFCSKQAAWQQASSSHQAAPSPSARLSRAPFPGPLAAALLCIRVARCALVLSPHACVGGRFEA